MMMQADQETWISTIDRHPARQPHLFEMVHGFEVQAEIAGGV